VTSSTTAAAASSIATTKGTAHAWSRPSASARRAPYAARLTRPSPINSPWRTALRARWISPHCAVSMQRRVFARACRAQLSVTLRRVPAVHPGGIA
jgi:hypothetical protein